MGQAFLSMLHDHPWFEPSVLVASPGREGSRYDEQTEWLLPSPIPDVIAGRILSSYSVSELRKNGVRIVFSGLPSRVAEKIEPELVENGFAVFSNASAMRYREEVPIIIPEINSRECRPKGVHSLSKRGFVITNANCTTTGLALPLAPLMVFGIRRIFVSTYQALSGAGRSGFSSPELRDNVMPWISGEEEKMEKELRKILSVDFETYPFCVRVPIPFGHLETVWVEFRDIPSAEDITGAWENFRFTDFDLPSLPRLPVKFMGGDSFPQPRMSFRGDPPGMEVFTGRVRRKKNLIGFVLMSNNIVRGAAGGSIANAELFLKLHGGEL